MYVIKQGNTGYYIANVGSTIIINSAKIFKSADHAQAEVNRLKIVSPKYDWHIVNYSTPE